MAKNANLHRAKREKNDEFYTRYDDIEKELVHYKDFFNGKTVYCNCDTIASNFMKFFDDKFDEYGLKKLIVTGLKSKGGILYQRTKNSVYVGDLKGDGRFQSEECIEFLKECDVVVTNPPFSLFREFVAQLVEYNKKFIIIGSIQGALYKNIFPLIKDNKIWLDVNAKGNIMTFTTDNGDVDITAWWYTNLSHSKRNTPLDLYKKYNPEEYPKFDNFDAINVKKVADIPVDYYGVMGVPITFLGKYCPDQFEIVGKTDDVEWLKECEFFTPPSAELAKQYRKQNKDWGVHHPYLLDSDGKPRITYRRLFIKRVS